MYKQNFKLQKAPLYVMQGNFLTKGPMLCVNFLFKKAPMLCVNFLFKKAPMLCVKFSAKKAPLVKR